jgi:hypothetical protein
LSTAKPSRESVLILILIEIPDIQEPSTAGVALAENRLGAKLLLGFTDHLVEPGVRLNASSEVTPIMAGGGLGVVNLEIFPRALVPTG